MYTEKCCRTCSKIFIPLSLHKDCTACRYKAGKVPCPQCGKGKTPNAALCVDCSVKVDRTGINGGNWQGGRTKHKKGYVMVFTPTHPRSKSNNGYVFEHILVMETRLKRYLLPTETVHHVNGVKDDNSDSNLELWIKPQPSGIRAEDALKWAYEIIERYSRLPLIAN